MFLVKILSWNVRGLCGFEKRKKVRKLLGEKKPSIICILETKLAKVADFLCSTLWGSSPHGFSFRSSVGASGCLLTMWDSDEVDIRFSFFLSYVGSGRSLYAFR